AITDGGNGGSGKDVTAGTAVLTAATSVGPGNALETQLGNLEGTASAGNFAVDDMGGLTIGGIGGTVGVNATTTVDVTTMTAMNVNENVTGGGNVTLTAYDTAGANDDLTVPGGVTVLSTGADITLSAGDDVDIDGNLTANSAGGEITINTDPAVGDPDVATGGTIDIANASVVTTNSGTFLNGGNDNDTFNFAVRTTTSFDVDGNPPVFGNPGVPPGDTLNLDLSSLVSLPDLTLGPTPGSGTFTVNVPDTHEDVVFDSIEFVNTNGQYHLVLDMKKAAFENGSGDTIDAQLTATGANLQLFVNTNQIFEGDASDVFSFTVIGSDDDDTLNIIETAGGLPSFSGQAPAVNNTGTGGGESTGSHLNATADTYLETEFNPTLFNAGDVTIHFEGGGGSDSLGATFITGHNAQYTSDALDTAGSGNFSALPTAGTPAGPDLLLSFADLATLSLVGAAGELLVDASSTPATSALTISDSGTAVDGQSVVSGNGGFAATAFVGFGDLIVRGGGSAGGTGEAITLVAVDGSAPGSGSALTTVLLDGDNIDGNDPDDDMINVQSIPATVSVTVSGAAGSDTINVSSNAPTNSGSLDAILGTLLVNGGAHDAGNTSLTIRGNTNTVASGDILNISDQGDASNNTYNLSDTTFQRTATGTVTYATVETVNLTAGTGNDDINVSDTLDSASTTVNANSGADDIDVTTTGTAANVVINGDGGNDAIDLVGTGTGAFVHINGGGANDVITQQSNAAGSRIRLNGDAGTDTINVWTGNATSLTDINGGANTDTVNIGSPANT
ncbi:MAG: hypothetical protein VB835_02115, partial [Pirellulales bacterium]